MFVYKTGSQNAGVEIWENKWNILKNKDQSENNYNAVIILV